MLNVWILIGSVWGLILVITGVITTPVAKKKINCSVYPRYKLLRWREKIAWISIFSAIGSIIIFILTFGANWLWFAIGYFVWGIALFTPAEK